MQYTISAEITDTIILNDLDLAGVESAVNELPSPSEYYITAWTDGICGEPEILDQVNVSEFIDFPHYAEENGWY